MYFALECIAKTRTGLVALNEPNQPRLGPLGASTIPRIWICSINGRKIPVKRKTQNVDEFFTKRPYLVVRLLKSTRFKSRSGPQILSKFFLLSLSLKTAYVILHARRLAGDARAMIAGTKSAREPRGC